jgi:hypothetical protein
MRAVQHLGHLAHDRRPRRVRELSQLLEMLAELLARTRGLDRRADQYCSLRRRMKIDRVS